ncbi:MAG: ArsR family transcriptional regulator [Gammaproteobacteria bacterium]|jgi:ArsR family transcriptional regulator
MKTTINTVAAAKALSALGHEARLSLYRLLVRAGTRGLNVGDISVQLAMPPSTLAHHLKALVEAGLVVQEKQGREVVNRPDFDMMRATMSFLTEECCTGVVLRVDAA